MNKNILYITCILFAFISCVKEEDEIFSNSADIRAEKLNDKCQETLTKATKGWIMQYFPNTELYGGYNLYMNFTEEDVEMRHESDFSKSEISKYSMRSDNSSVLSFDTYNSILHQYSDPGKDGVGYGGDFEFVIKNVTDDYIILKGVKGGDFMFMNRIPENSHTEYLEAINKMKNLLFPTTSNPQWFLISGNDTLFLRMNSRYTKNFEVSKDKEFIDITRNASVQTASGIQFNPPLNFKDNSYDCFTLSDDLNSLIYNEDAAIKIIGQNMTDSYFDGISLLKKYTFREDNISDQVKAVYEKIKTSFGAKNMFINKISLTCTTKTGAPTDALYIETNKGSGYLYFTKERISQTSLKYTYSGTGDNNGKVFYNYDGIPDLVEIINSSFEIIPGISGLNMSSYKFTNSTNQDIWFILSL